jgi:hypothetical protein
MNEEEKIQPATEKELDSLYTYLSMNWDDMNETEKNFWSEIMSRVDPDFDKYEDEQD